MEFLGRGINVLEYDYPKTPTRNQILDLQALQPATINSPVMKLHVTYGSNFEEFASKLARNAGIEGNYGAFSAKLETKYLDKATHSLSTQFVEISKRVSGRTHQVSRDPYVIRQHLTPAFAQALATSSPLSLFANYGTHVMTAVDIGGEAKYSAHSTATSQMSETEFKAAAKAEYNFLFGDVKVNTGVSSSSSRASASLVGDKSILFIGGNSARNDGLDAWSNTVKSEPALLGPSVLVPVWNLTDDPARAEALKLAFHQETAKHPRLRVFRASNEQRADLSDLSDFSVDVTDEYKLLSGGALVDSRGAGHLLTASYPIRNNAWRANGKAHGESDPAALTLFAVGLSDPDDIWDVKIYKKVAPYSGGRKQVVAEVEAPYVMVGGGARIEWTGDGVMLTGSWPSGENKWSVEAKDHGWPASATITSYAIGLKSKLPGVRVVNKIEQKETQDGPGSTRRGTSVSSSRGYVTVGGGALADWRGEGVLLTGSHPDPENRKIWTMLAKDHLYEDGSRVIAYAIGIKVIVD